MKAEVPAVVVGEGLNALGVVRSLGAAGVPVIVVAAASGPATRSRYTLECVHSDVDGPGLLGALDGIAKAAAEKPVLFLTQEKTVHTVSAHRDAVCSRYRIRLPEHDTLMKLMHKPAFQELAERWKSLIPGSVNVRSTADLPALRGLRFPCVLKPSEKNYRYGERFKKAYVVQSAEEVERLYEEIVQVAPDMIVQEWIDGEDSDVYFCLQYVGAGGEPVASFPGRKIRSWPPRIGGTASCTAAWDDADTLTRATQEFFSRAGFSGMGAMEYKRDRRDGRFYMVEPTVGRTDFQEEVATLHGINIPLAAYCHELGLDPEPAVRPIRPARRVWREPGTDRQSLLLQERSPEFSGLPVWSAYWRYSDPGPWFQWLGAWFATKRRGLRRRLGVAWNRILFRRADDKVDSGPQRTNIES